MNEVIEFIRTPLPMLQIITGGGIRFSTIVELQGPNKSGKSTTCYQSAGYFLEDYGDNAILKILDSETSADYIRLLSFNIDVSDERVEIVPATFVEDGMSYIFKWIENLPSDKRMMIIWDTLAACPTRSAYETAMAAKNGSELTMYSGGMADRPRVIKHYLRQVMSLLYGKKASLWMPNQMFVTFNHYGSALQAGEGSALQHDKHYSILFARKDKDVTTLEETSSVVSETLSQYALVKSKFSPEFAPNVLHIDNTAGGIIDERLSLIETCVKENLITRNGSWYKIGNEGKNYRMGDIQTDDEAFKLLTRRLITKFRASYPTVDRVYLVQGFPPLTEEERQMAIKKKKTSSLSFLSCFEACHSASSFTPAAESSESDFEPIEEVVEK